MDTIASLYPDPRFHLFHEAMKRGDLSTRKHIVMLSRHQGLPRNGGNMYHITNPTIVLLHRILAEMSKTTGWPDVMIHHDGYYEGSGALFLDECFSDPLLAGALIMGSFIYNPGDEEIEEIRLASYMKEINVMDTTGVTHSIDFSAFFGEYDTPIHVDIPANPRMARHVHLAIDSWITKLSSIDHPLTPHISTKLLPTHTRQEMENIISLLMEEPSTATPASLEWLSFAHNIYQHGPAELKQRWYANGVSPRSYFVAGAENYFDSRYTRNMWNSLVDSLEATNRFSRVDVRRIHVEDVKHALFYDLTSFTSNMALQPVFLEMLALYCTGKGVYILDSKWGLLLEDLGDIIRQYNNTNSFPEYICPALPTMMPCRHGVAGFLGVYGNIATCTFLHGAILLQLSTHIDGCGCAGDDAVVVVGEGEDEKVFCCVRLLGILATEKTFSSEYPDVIYLKRRTWVNFRSNDLQQSSFLQFPSMFGFMSKRDLYRFREAGLTENDRRRLTVSSLYATFLSASRLRQHAQSAYDLILTIYEKLRIPKEGYVPQCSRKRKRARWFEGLFIPSIDTFGASNFVEQTLRNCYKGEVLLPKRTDIFEKRVAVEANIVVKSRPCELLTFCCKMGWVKKIEGVKELYAGQTGLDLLIKEYNKFEKKERSYSYYHILPCFPEDFRGGNLVIEAQPVYDLGEVSSNFDLLLDYSAPNWTISQMDDTDMMDDWDYEEGEIIG